MAYLFYPIAKLLVLNVHTLVLIRGKKNHILVDRGILACFD